MAAKTPSGNDSRPGNITRTRATPTEALTGSERMRLEKTIELLTTALCMKTWTVVDMDGASIAEGAALMLPESPRGSVIDRSRYRLLLNCGQEVSHGYRAAAEEEHDAEARLAIGLQRRMKALARCDRRKRT